MTHSHSRRSRIRVRRRRLAASLAAVFACAGVHAGDFFIPVENCNDAGPGSLRDVIAHALNGDHLAFGEACTVSLTGGPIVIDTDVNGTPFTHLDISGFGDASVTIDGGGLDRVFVQDAGADALLTFTNIRIANGRSVDGGNGGCVLAHGDVELANVEITGCATGTVSGDAPFGDGPVRGGGLYAAGSVTIENSVIASNRIDGNGRHAYGGGVFAGRALTLTSSRIEDNSALSIDGGAYGGGFAAGDHSADVQATVAIASSTITGNTVESHCGFCGARGAGAWIQGTTTSTGGAIGANHAISTYGYGTGGGLYAIGSTTLTGTSVHCNTADRAAGVGVAGPLSISGATLDCNAANADGGAVYLIGGSLVLTDSTIAANTAGDRGGGIFLRGYGDVATVNSTISGNSAANGGAIANTYGSLHLSNSTLASNTASGHGGGVWFHYAYYPFELTSTIVSGNTAASVPEDIWPPGVHVDGSHSLVVAAAGVELPGDTLAADPLLLPLGANGGATPTHALGEGSPAIDTGGNPLALPHDQRGEGFMRAYGKAPDIGAFEVQPPGAADPIFTDGFDP